VTRNELIRYMAAQTGMTLILAAQAYDAAVGAAAIALARGEEVQLVGLGKLRVVDRAARSGRNPRTGETLALPASRSVKFKASKSLSAAVQPAPPPPGRRRSAAG
jgi:DNA-binding protein HU-beta